MHASILPPCTQCEALGEYGVEMSPYATTEPWRDGYRCRYGHTMAREYHDRPALDEPEPGPYDDWRDVYDEETSRRGRCVPPDKGGGGDATGRAKERVNPHKWMRRGA